MGKGEIGEVLHSLPLPEGEKKLWERGSSRNFGVLVAPEPCANPRVFVGAREEAGLPERKRARPLAEGGGEGDDGVP